MIKICAIADLHGWLPKVPECDLLLIAGDICSSSRILDQELFLRHKVEKWLDEMPAKEVVFVAGNHDWIFQKARELVPKLPWYYLEDSPVELFGLKIWGTPHQREYNSWAFNLPESELQLRFEKIPTDTDILVTHSPPYGLGDHVLDAGHVGSTSLRTRLEQLNIKLHTFGHIHEGRGIFEFNKTLCVNSTLVDENYRKVYTPLSFVYDNGTITYGTPQ